MDYVNIDINVTTDPLDQHSYLVAARITGRNPKAASSRFEFSPETWKSIEPSLNILRARDATTPFNPAQKVRDFGKYLFKCLINGDVRRLYDEKKQDARNNSKILRLRLTLIPLDMVMLPWELLFDERDSQYLCLIQHPRTILIRSTEEVKAPGRSVYEPPLRILGMIADPRDLVQLQGDDEKEAINKVLKPLSERGLVTIAWKAGKHTDLVDLKHGVERWDVFHFTGHGSFDETSQQGFLAFEDDNRCSKFIPAVRFRASLQSTTKLVVLNACETARGNRFDYLSNIAHSLVSQGIPAVVAMQFKILDKASIQFSKTFYTLLAEGMAIDVAVAEARYDIYNRSDTDGLDWAAPLLYVSSLKVPSFQQASKTGSLSTNSEPNSQPSTGDGNPASSTIPLPPEPVPDTAPLAANTTGDTVPLSPEPTLDPPSLRENTASNDDLSASPSQAQNSAQGDNQPPNVAWYSRVAQKYRSLPVLLQVVSILLALLVVGGCFFAVSAFTNHPTNSGNTVTTKNSGTPTSAGNASSCASSASVIIGTDFPSSEVGEDTAQKGADLAIKENHNLGQGYTLDACDKDDASGPLLHYDPAVGAQNMRQFANDPRVLGVVGPEDTDVALAEVPIAISAGLVMISPSVTNPCLTLQQDCSAQSVNLIHPSGKASTFFRIPGNDVKQGQADASLLYQSLGMSSVCVVDDQGTYGKGLADAFSENFKNYGGHILGGRFQMVKDEPQPQLADLAARIVALHPQAVFLGGSASNGPGFFKHQLALKGFNGPFVGGDGIGSDDQFIKDAGVDASNTYATSLGPDPSTLSPIFIKAYQKAYGEAPTSRSALGYDAAMILINAIQDALKTHAQNRRSTVLDNVQHPSQSYQGLTGTINFNSYGDNAGRKIFSVYAVEQGHWVYQPKYTVPVN